MLGCLAVGFGAFVLHYFMSHHWVGRAKTKSVPWLVTSRLRFGLQCGESSWLLSVRLTLSLNVGAVRDGGWEIFLAHRDLSASWCSEVSLFDASPCRGASVAASIPVAVVKESGRHKDRWRFSRRQEFDAFSRSVVEKRHFRSAR